MLSLVSSPLIYTVVTSSPETLHPHRQCRSPYRGRFTLASHTSYTRFSSAHYFDSYGIVPLVPPIQAYIRRNCIIWDYNKRQLQGLTSDVRVQYSCLFALYMDGDTPLSNSSHSSPVEAMQTDR